MNFQGHLTGGLIAGAAVTVLAPISGYVRLSTESLAAFMDTPLSFHGDISVLILLFLTTCFMALFPDLDTASIPQRWFYRILFVVQLALFYHKQMDWFAVLAFVSILPIVHKHRGWTHWKIAPWLMSLFLAVVFEYIRAKESWFGSFQWENVGIFLQQYWIYLVACVVGHYTHLLLDSRHVRFLPFIKNPQNHH